MVLSLLVSTRNARNKIIMNLQPAIHPFSLTCPHEGCVEAETESEPKNLRAHEKQNNAPQKACVCVCEHLARAADTHRQWERRPGVKVENC